MKLLTNCLALVIVLTCHRAVMAVGEECFQFPNHIPIKSTMQVETAAMPTVIRTGECSYEMWYNSTVDQLHAVIMHTESSDGINWSNDTVALEGTPGSWDCTHVYNAAVLKEGATYKMWYTGYCGSSNKVGYATSKDGINWTKHPLPVVDNGSWDNRVVRVGSVIFDPKAGLYRMWYTGGSEWYHNLQVGYATSPDGTTWTKQPKPVFVAGQTVEWIQNHVNVVQVDGEFEMYWSSSTGDIRLATSADGDNWNVAECGPVLRARSTGWEGGIASGVCVIYQDGIRQIWYGANHDPSSIGYSLSGLVSECATDVTDDGATDVLDLLQVINAWGMCP